MKKLLSSLKINSSRIHLEKFLAEAAALLSPQAIVLDAGAGKCMYKSLFSHIKKYETADFCHVNKEYGKIDYICDLKSIPVENSKYDVVICTQVLEHIPEPKAVLREFQRILKFQGELWISVPFFFEEHEVPYDYYRYTQFGLSYLLEETGFKIKKVQRLEGYYGTFSYQLKTAAKSLPLHPKYYGGGFLGFIGGTTAFLIKPVFAILGLLFARLDLKYKNVSSGYSKNYVAIAEKKNGDS